MTTAELAAPAGAITAGGAIAADSNALARFAARALRAAAASWFAIAAAGQMIFLAYVAIVYGGAAAAGHIERWNKELPHGYVAGDGIGNFAVALHLALAVVVTLAGALQLIPAIRQRWPAFHRWNGRAYLTAIVTTSVAGLYMVWIRGGAVGDLSQHLGITLDALLIIAFAWLAYHHARARRIARHRPWALRLFLVANGVWFFRIGLALWIVLNHGPAGFDPKTFTGPFITFLSFADYLLPLAALEGYLRAQNAGPRAQLAMTAALAALTLATAAGVACATLILWLPRV